MSSCSPISDGERRTARPRGEALAGARDLLRELIAATMREGKGLPKPSRATGRRPLVVPPVPIALKAAFYEASRKAGDQLDAVPPAGHGRF